MVCGAPGAGGLISIYYSVASEGKSINGKFKRLFMGI
jgi:hypothetical protein